MQNLREILDQRVKEQQAFELFSKMDSYGRKFIEKNGQEIVDQTLINHSKVLDVVRFEQLEKGCETWLLGEPYPVRGCYQNDRCVTVTQFKKLIPSMVRTLKKHKILGSLYLLLNWKEYLYFIHKGMSDVYYPSVEFYSQPVREIYRVLSGFENTGDIIRDVICAILEFDTAYKYRVQDVISELNKESFSNNPIKEMKRLSDILFEREVSAWHNGMGKFKNYLPLLFIYLRFNRKLLNRLKSIVSNLDVEEIKLDVSDIWWTNKIYPDYNFRGLDFKTRQQENEDRH